MSQPSRRGIGVVITIVLAACGVFIVIPAIYTTHETASYTPMASYAMVANEEFGFVSGEDYPLMIGERQNGQVPISYTSPDGSTYSFNVSTDEVEWVLKETDTPTYKIYLSETDGAYARMEAVGDNSCDWQWFSSFLTCERDPEREYQRIDTVEHLTLGDVVRNGFEGGVITLTTDQYNEIFGIMS